MARTVIVKVPMTDSDKTFAAGTETTGLQVTLMRADVQLAQQNIAPDSNGDMIATFDNIEAGIVVALAQSLGPNGPLGDVMTSAQYTVDPDPVSIKIPLSIDLTVS